MLLLLEDNTDRIRGFRAILSRDAPDLKIMIWSDAHAMTREMGVHLTHARLISLDHDLYVPRGAPDPGDGLDVARYLVSLPIAPVPVIIHSSNSDRSRCMVGEFELAGWPCTRVLPFGEAWIEHDWRLAALPILLPGWRNG